MLASWRPTAVPAPVPPHSRKRDSQSAASGADSGPPAGSGTAGALDRAGSGGRPSQLAAAPSPSPSPRCCCPCWACCGGSRLTSAPAARAAGPPRRTAVQAGSPGSGREAALSIAASGPGRPAAAAAEAAAAAAAGPPEQPGAAGSCRSEACIARRGRVPPIPSGAAVAGLAAGVPAGDSCPRPLRRFRSSSSSSLGT